MTEKIVQTILHYYPAAQAIYLFGSYGTEYETPGSDADIALLLSPQESKIAGFLLVSDLHHALERLLNRDVDLINLRQASTVLQKEVIAADRRVFCREMNAADEFEMLTLSLYQKLNEERAGIVESALAGGRFHDV